MKIKLISCWYNTSYAAYSQGLRQALERDTGEPVGVIASNCGCNDPMDGVFFDQNCDYFKMPHLKYWNSQNPVKRWIRNSGRQILYHERARRYMQLAQDAQILHFQQTLNAYGSNVVFNWLEMNCLAARVVTVHELDPYQQDYPEVNLTYNLADRIIVHATELRDALVDYGVDAGRIDIIEHGVQMMPVSEQAREGIVFYGGHKLNASKGLDVLCKAMALVRRELGAATPAIKIHGFYGDDTRNYGLACIAQSEVADLVQWLDRLDTDAVAREYQKSLLCVLPFTGSFAGFAAANAMANGVPVIGTRHAGLPEHLGDTGTWIEPNDPEGLAREILRLLGDAPLRNDIAKRARARAQEHLSWDAIARKTLESYRRALDRRSLEIAA
ncbi:MAG: glycosyltransferase family 4 protein [Burkholderiaceae bacterium]|jgi:glycosyltransferase involved in cell wall biosynthesis